jgi:toxin CcdB
MAQFDVHRNAAGAYPPFLVRLNHDLVSDLPTVVVAPLVPLCELDNLPMARLLPVFEIGGEPYALLTVELAGVPKPVLGEMVASLAARRTDIIAALDFLFTGI